MLRNVYNTRTSKAGTPLGADWSSLFGTLPSMPEESPVNRQQRLLGGYWHLILACLRQAIVDARGTSPLTSEQDARAARIWLREEGAEWCEALGLPGEMVRQYVSVDQVSLS